MTLADQLELVAALGLSVKTKGSQRWDPLALARCDQMSPFVDMLASLRWEELDHKEWKRLGIIDVQSEPPLHLFICA